MDPFAGFGPDAIPFLKALAENQSKPWFDENRATYEDAIRTPMGLLVEDLAARFRKARIGLTGDAKHAVYRPYRDVRFTKDKSPYKTHAGMVLSPGGTKQEIVVLYFHLEPAGSFVAAGSYQPDPADLASFRTRLVAEPKPFLKVVRALEKQKLPLVTDDKMKRTPKGFEEVSNPVVLEMVKLKSFIVRRDIPAERLGYAELADDLFQFGKTVRPLLGWLQAARE